MENTLHTKTLIMLVAPSAMGKSTIMNQAVRLDTQFARVRSFTTRRPRANDEPGQYIYLTQDELLKERSHDTVVTEMTFSTGQTYGTLCNSYSGQYSLLDTMANSVEEYRSLPFRATKTISLTAHPDQWREWFVDRFPDSDSYDAAKRLEEAVASIEWSLADPETLWLVNDDTPETIARNLIDLSLDQAQSDTNGPDHARGILELIQQGTIWG